MGLELGSIVSLGFGQDLVGSSHFGGSSSPNALSFQVCLCVAANVAYGLQQNVVYVDSSGGLTASRLLQLLQARTPDEEEQVRGRRVEFL